MYAASHGKCLYRKLVRDVMLQGRWMHEQRRWRWRGAVMVMSEAARDAAEERRRRKRQLRVNLPLLDSLREKNEKKVRPYADWKSKSLPQSINALVGERLSLHNNIQHLNRQGRLSDALDIATQAMFSRVHPTVFTCNSILSLLHRSSHHLRALRFFHSFRHCGVTPNIVSYNIVLAIHCLRLDMPRVFDTMQMIEDAGLTPSNVTYSHMIEAHLRLRMYGEVLSLFKQMLEKCHGAEPALYASTIEGFVDGGAMREAEELYLEMRRRGSLFSEEVFCNLIKGFFEGGYIQKALDVFNFIPEKVDRTVLSYNAVMDGYCVAGQMEEALVFLKKMEEEDNLKPNAGSYAALMNGHIIMGEMDKAESLFSSILGRGCPLEASAYNVLLETYFRRRIFHKVNGLLHDMINGRHEADATTYYMMIEGFSKQGQIMDAYELFKRMIDVGFKPEVAIWNMWLGILCKERRNNAALDLFERMLGGGQIPDLATYDALAEGFKREGRLEEIKSRFREVVERVELCDELRSVFNAKILEPFKNATDMLRPHGMSSYEQVSF